MRTFDISFNTPCPCCGVSMHSDRTVEAETARDAAAQVPEATTIWGIVETLPSGVEINWREDNTIIETALPGEPWIPSQK